MHKSRICSVISIFFISILLLACEKVEETPAAPERPKSVPVESIWVGGLDGGVFLNLKVNENSSKNKYWGEVYYSSGDLAYKGEFKVVPEESSSFEYKAPSSYQGWDGDTIYLSNGGQLQVVE